MDQTDTGDSSRASGHRQNYDVFLSHSGKQRNFVRQLCRDLRKQGLSCFFDEDPECLPVGADIHSSISEAVRACRVAVLILSKEYLEAKSSMEELSAFVEARDIKCTNPDLKIIPLFFLIPPSALRAIRKGNENWEELGILWKTQVKWIDALHAIPDSSGVIFRVGDDEKEIRDFIVEQIQNILSKHMQLRVSYPRYHVRGMQGKARMCQAVADFFIKVPRNKKGIRTAGLYGRAGVGKTSLGRAFCNFKLVEFVGRVCHLDFSRGDPLHRTKLALQYLTERCQSYVQTLTSRNQALDEFYRGVRGQRVLLVLDNITQASVEEVLSYLKADLGEDSWILLSAQSLDVLLTRFKFDALLPLMPVPRLYEQEAIAILLQRVSAAQEVSTLGADDSRVLALKCAETCLFRDTRHNTRENAQTFHPLALKVLGSFLFSKYGLRLSHWIEEIDATVDLKGDSFHKVFAVLGSAFDCMISDYRDIFMRLTVYMLPDMSADKVKNWLAISCHKEIQFIEQAVMHLVEMGFIGEFTSEILVDNICMEFAQWKANKMERWLWWKEDYDLSTRRIITSDRDGFVSAKFEKCRYQTISPKYLINLVELQLIDVKGVRKLDLHPMGRLRSITLRNCMHFEGFYEIENLIDLAWLQIIGEYPMFTLPQLTSLGSLQYLEINLSGSQVFNQLGDLSHCVWLREINVVCPSLLDFPSLEGMVRLEKVEFSLCDKVKGPLNCTDCVMLQTIVLKSCRQMTASPVFSGCKNLSKLVLHECDAVTVCTDVDEPNALKTLELFISSKAASLPTNLESCCELEDLQLLNMWDLMELPSFKRLSNLTVLKLGKCGIRDPPDLTGCGRLQDVYFFKLRNLEKLPNFSSLKELKKLSLCDCSSVQDPPNIEGCHQLQVFHLLYNDNMKGISKMDKCAQLEEIQVSWHSENEVAYEGIDPNSCQVDDDLEFSLQHFTDEKFGKIGDVSMPEELKQLQWLEGKIMRVKRYFRGVKLYYSVTFPYGDAPTTDCSQSSITLIVIDGKVRPFMSEYTGDAEHRWFNKVREYFAAKEDIARASASSDILARRLAMDQTDTGGSSRARQNYDVFLSYSGKRRNFVGQLCTELGDRGLSCFFDKDRKSLPVGADFQSSISEAVRACRVAVLILSKEYLEEMWSMEELSALVEARDIKCTNPDLKIIPLFFIQPGALKTIAEGNEKWKKLEISEETQAKWLDALNAIRGSSGVNVWDGHDKELRQFAARDDEVKLRIIPVKEIGNILVKYILRMFSLMYHVRGMQGEARMCQAVADFFIDVPRNEKGILIAGLYGRAGVGKTSLGRAFCNFKLVEFVGRVCHLDFSRGDSLHRRKLALQYLAERRQSYVQTLTSRDQALDEFYGGVRGQRVLLVLDNITQESLEEVLSYLKADLGENSWILLSARSLYVLSKRHFKFKAKLPCMPVPRLDEKEAIAILLQRVSAAQYVSTLGADDRALALKCAKRCLFRDDTNCSTSESVETFHPLALKVLGSHLFSKYGLRLSHWIDEIDATVDLKGDSFHGVFAVLGRAFDCMSSDYRDIFIRLTKYMLPDMSPYKVKKWLAISCDKEIRFIEQAVEDLCKMAFIEEFGKEICIHELYIELVRRKVDMVAEDGKEVLAPASSSQDFQQPSLNCIQIHPDIKDLILHREAYCPETVALGVCNHRGSFCVSETSEENVNMVDEKMKALCTTANRLKEGKTVEYLIEEIKKLRREIVYWYKYNGNLTGDILAWNFAMDACFILEFFRASYRFKNLNLEREIMIDIFKIENQIPLFILRKILELEFGTPQKAISQLASLMCMRPRFAILPFSLKFMESKDLQTEIEETIEEDPWHLLQLLSITIEASLQLSNVPIRESGVEFLSDLADVMLAVAHRDVDIGDNFLIRFKPSRNGQIQFKKGWFGSCALYLPQIYLCKETEPLFWNLISLASTSENNIIGNFIFFMNWIISFHKKSIVALKEKKLIISGKDNAELSEMFSKLSLTVCKSIGPFGKIQKQIEEHHNSSFSKWMIRSIQSICLLFQFPLIGLILVLAFVVSIFFTR